MSIMMNSDDESMVIMTMGIARMLMVVITMIPDSPAAVWYELGV